MVSPLPSTKQTDRRQPLSSCPRIPAAEAAADTHLPERASAPPFPRTTMRAPRPEREPCRFRLRTPRSTRGPRPPLFRSPSARQAVFPRYPLREPTHPAVRPDKLCTQSPAILETLVAVSVLSA